MVKLVASLTESREEICHFFYAKVISNQKGLLTQISNIRLLKKKKFLLFARGPAQKISPFPITGYDGEDATNNTTADNNEGDEKDDDDHDDEGRKSKQVARPKRYDGKDDDDEAGRKSKQVASWALIEYFNQRSVSGPAKPQKQRHSVIKDHKFSTGKFS